MPSINDVSRKFIDRQRKRLEALRAELLNAENSAAQEAIDLQESQGGEAREYEDDSQSLDRKEVLQGKHDVDRRRLGEIDRALKKIELGSYGHSDLSGKPISDDQTRSAA